MDSNDKKLIDILQSIDESLKILSGRKEKKEPEVIKKTYAEKYFRKSEDGKWEAEALE